MGTLAIAAKLAAGPESGSGVASGRGVVIFVSFLLLDSGRRESTPGFREKTIRGTKPRLSAAWTDSIMPAPGLW
jgi:hypothetical protein